MLEALGWGALAASSLVIGAVLGILRPWRLGAIGGVLAFGAGALVAGVAFELAQKGIQLAGPIPTACGLALGAVTFYLASRAVERLDQQESGAPSGLPLALGGLLDGIPEQLVLGINLARDDIISVALFAAIFISNLPESIGSAANLKASGWRDRRILALWLGVAAICTAATVVGHQLADHSGAPVQAVIDGFAAGALLVMLINAMIPEAREKAGPSAGLAAVLGFAVAAGLSAVTS